MLTTTFLKSYKKFSDKNCDKIFGKSIQCIAISLHVETRTALLDEKHLVDKTSKFPLTLFNNADFFEKVRVPKGSQKVFLECFFLAEFLCSTIRWWRCRAVKPTYR